MTNTTLFEPYALCGIALSNRIVMAPLTRNRAGAGFVPGEMTAEYCAQRASAGLIISEATKTSIEANSPQGDRPVAAYREAFARYQSAFSAAMATGDAATILAAAQANKRWLRYPSGKAAPS